MSRSGKNFPVFSLFSRGGFTNGRVLEYWKKTGCLIMYSYTVFHADLGRSTIFSGHMSTKGLLQGLSAAQKRYQLNRLKVGTVEKFLLMSTVGP